MAAVCPSIAWLTVRSGDSDHVVAEVMWLSLLELKELNFDAGLIKSLEKLSKDIKLNILFSIFLLAPIKMFLKIPIKPNETISLSKLLHYNNNYN